MVLMNAGSRSRHASSITRQNQGGGDKKAGFPYQVGRGWRTSIAFNSTDPVHGHCLTLKCTQMNLFPNARPSRPIGSTNQYVSYWHVPGTGR
jgi:hypothetical protein